MPQYVLNLIRRFKDYYKIEVVECKNYSDSYVVQRNKIKSLVPFHQINGEYERLLQVITSADVVHFQEIPETFIPEEVLSKIYNKEREYRIAVTTHSSFTNPQTIKYTADKFILVSNWSKKVFENYYKGRIPCELLEYEIEYHEYDKIEAKNDMGWDLALKHILHVGLFTPGKNQKEIIDIAKMCLNAPVKFHFVGNQAENFRDYWEPLMKELPANCVWHGEQENTDCFYKAADAFYFPSTYELNPISIKEAIGFGIPVFIKQLDTYENYYDKIATYISNDVLENKKILLNNLGVKEYRGQAIHLLSRPDDDRERKSIKYVSQLRNFGIEYKQVVNKPFDEAPPAEFCRRPDNIGITSEYLGDGLGVLTGRHYGNYKAHVDAIFSIDVDKYDFTIIFEGDANLEYSVEEFIGIVNKACALSYQENTPYVSFSNNPCSSKTLHNEDFYLTSQNQDLAHCYLVPSKDKQWYLDRISDCPWDGYDVWLNYVFICHPRKRFTTTRCWSNQIEGMSLIDPVVKWGVYGQHYDYIEIGTSDFETIVQTCSDDMVGLSIEPIKSYLDKLPDRQGNTKLNVAITDEDCYLPLYYVKPEDIISNKLPDWMKGCNSVGSKHPSVLRELEQRGLLNIYSEETIEGVSFPSLVKNYNVGSVDYLKIDTEGHDFVILRSLLKTSLRPNKIRFEANSLYKEDDIKSVISEMSNNGYVLVQRTLNDVILRLKTDDDECDTDGVVMIMSTGRRLKYFEKTIFCLLETNPGISAHIKKIWVLDDRSTLGDRVEMSNLMNQKFGNKWNMISYNGDAPFEFVDKFKMIRNLIDKNDVVFLLEDDWGCHDYLNLPYHINKLKKSDWTQIAFADPYDIQDSDTQNSNKIDLMYWKNPWPNSFRHPIRWDGDMCWWSLGRINNYTNNPSLIKGEVFLRGQYINHKNFEASFADQINGNQVFTQEALFRHFGDDSLINKL